jgi:hypothetical protein
MDLLACLMGAVAIEIKKTGVLLFILTREDLVIEVALMGHPGDPQIILAHRSRSQDEWRAWIGGLIRTEIHGGAGCRISRPSG